MTLRFIDGCQHYASADATKKYDGACWTPVVDATKGRRGTGALYLGNQAYVGKIVPQATTIIVGFWYRNATGLPTSASLNASGTHFLKLLALGAEQLTFSANNSGVIGAYRGSTQVAVSASGALPGSGSYIEIKVLASQTVGTVEVRVDGVAVISATGLDTCNTTDTFYDQVQLWGWYPGAAVSNEIHDIYICDSAGSLNNNFLGDCRVDTVRPASDGSTTDFTPSTGIDNYALVDETTPSSADYNSSSTVAAIDLYGLDTSLPTLASETVFGIQVNAANLKVDTGTRTVATLCRSSAVTVIGATVAASTTETYAVDVYEQDSGATAWTKAKIEAAEAGIKIIA